MTAARLEAVVPAGDANTEGPANMDDRNTATRLAQLRFIEMETLRVIDAVSERTGDDEIAARIAVYILAHEQHARELYDLIVDLDGNPAEVPDELRELTEQLVRLAHAAAGQDEAMVRLLVAERVCAAEYAATLELRPPEPVAAMLRRHLAEERRHVAFVEQRVPVVAAIERDRMAAAR